MKNLQKKLDLTCIMFLCYLCSVQLINQFKTQSKMNELFLEILENRKDIVKFYSPELVEFYELFGVDALNETKNDAQNLKIEFPNRDYDFYINKINSTVYFDVDESNAKDLEIYQKVVFQFLNEEISEIENKSIKEYNREQDDYPENDYTITIIK